MATTKPNVKTWVIMYSELIGNYKKYRIKSLYDNIMAVQHKAQSRMFAMI